MKWFKLLAAFLPLTLIACGGEDFSINGQKTATSEQTLTTHQSADLITGASPLLLQKDYGIPRLANMSPLETPEFTTSKINSTHKSNSSNTVYRFLNLITGVHFYTISILERLNVESYLPQFQFEGAAFSRRLLTLQD